MKNINDLKLYSVKQADTRMGISQQHLRLLLKNGIVDGVKLDGTWVVLDLNYTGKRKPKGGKNETNRISS